MKNTLFLLSTLVLISCNQLPKADLLVKNGSIYTVNENFDLAEAFVVKDGMILEVGTMSELESSYKVSETFDAKGKTILPGLIDGHAHLYNLGMMLQVANLRGTTSYEDVLDRMVAFQKEKNSDFIQGRAWDQNDWETKEYPTKDRLDELFPNTPVALKRVDGHAYLVNSKTLELAGITGNTKVAGGEVILKDGEPTGILIDSPMELVNAIIPEPSLALKIRALKEAEKVCLGLGLTTISDAGLDRDVIELIDSLQQTGDLVLRVYAMVSNTEENLNYYLDKGIIKTPKLNVRSVKVYADGALGSRGAALREPYSDLEGHYGTMITPIKELDILAQRISEAGYQMNTHSIGDSAVASVLRAYNRNGVKFGDKRWRIEHAQVVSPSNFSQFSKNIIPSIQPTHATSDMYWAEERVGPDRVEGAYAYKTLLDHAKIISLGTDFPVEKVNPMYTFYAAVARKDLNNYPEGGYRIEEGLSREEALRGMTIWAAYSNFEDLEKGSIEPGKLADFVVLDRDIMTMPLSVIPEVKVTHTFISGKLF